jgi:uncharacterized membrane protein YccC
MKKASVTQLDIRIGVSVLICVLTSTLLDLSGMFIHFDGVQFEIVQKMTSAIACILCCQDVVSATKTAGIYRMIITAVGGLTGIFVIYLDSLINNAIIMVLMIGIGIVLTLLLCKVCNVPYINARIGALTFVLVTCTFQGNARIMYGIMRFASTFYGVVIAIFVTWIFGLISAAMEKRKINQD